MTPVLVVRRSTGFTLVEILVVILIIAVLAGLLFPVFAQSKRRAKDTGCISNLRQLGMSCQMYMSDNNDILPPETPYVVAFNHTVVNPLLGYGMTTQLYQCPNYAPEPPATPTAPRIDYVSRYAIMGRDLKDIQVTWRVVPTDGFVLAYCPYHRNEGTVEVGQPSGFFQDVRITGGAERIPASRVKSHTEDWGGFGPNIDPASYAWLQFPGETFPPTIIKNDQ